MISPRDVRVTPPKAQWMERHTPILWSILREYIIMHWQDRSEGPRGQEYVYYCRLHHCFIQLNIGEGDTQASEVDGEPCWECWRAAEKYESAIIEHRQLEVARRKATSGDTV
jgi:hypothetical protein